MKKNVFIYLTALFAAAAVKFFGSTADSNCLAWILTPVSWWVASLSGISFQYVSHVGYVSRAHRFMIVPSCAGVRFLLLTFLMLVFSFTHLMHTQRRKVLWLAFSAGFSYIATVFVNGIRITISIYLPELLVRNEWMPAWLSAKGLHTMIGTAVYFSFLFVIYFLAGRICAHLFCIPHETKAGSPVFWYVATVLVLPFFSRLYHNQWTGFGQYVMLVSCVCAVVILFFTMIKKHAGA